MSFSGRARDLLLAKTREPAIALVEDLKFLRTATDRTEPDRQEARNLTTIVRRLLLDQGLAQVAIPRIGRIKLAALDLKPFYEAEGNRPYPFFSGARHKAFNVEFTGLVGGSSREPPRNIIAFDPKRLVFLRVETFLTQRVFCFSGRWVSRKNVLDYVAYKLSGIHAPNRPDTLSDYVLEQIRYTVRYSRNADGGLHMSFRTTPEQRAVIAAQYEPNSLDPLLIEILDTARLITESPDVIRLEKIIRSEIGLP